MEGLVSGYFISGLAASTHNTYLSAKKKYLTFCQQYSLSPLPLCEYVTCLFVAFLSKTGINPTSISTYLAAIRHLQVESGLPPPQRADWPRLQYTLRGIKRSNATANKRSRLPITGDIMQALLTTLQGDSSRDQYTKDMLWAACCMGFFGFLRAGEFTTTQSADSFPIQVADVSVDSHTDPSVVRIFLRRSKTDPLGRGTYIYLGRTKKILCPVVAILRFMSIRPQVAGPLLVLEDGRPLLRDHFVTEIKSLLSVANYNAGAYAGHSFRIGAATSAALAGLPVHLIKTLGRWKSEAYQVYVRTPFRISGSGFKHNCRLVSNITGTRRSALRMCIAKSGLCTSLYQLLSRLSYGHVNEGAWWSRVHVNILSLQCTQKLCSDRV